MREKLNQYFLTFLFKGMRSEGKEGNTKMQGKVQSSIKQKKISNPY